MISRRTLLAGSALALTGIAASCPNKEVFFDDFSGSRLGPSWEPYTGRPASDAKVQWDPSEVRVRDSRLILSGSPDGQYWRTGAVSQWREAHKYGRWEVRMRALAHPTLSYHVLLWPQADMWPPEIDLAESFTADRATTEAFVHWRADGQRHKRQFSLDVDATQFATWAVEWTADYVRWSYDGTTFAEVTGDEVPDEPMWLAIQVEAQVPGDGGGGASDVLEVDWVRITSS
ncbi:glycoside hydrolase family 16 protein [Corynebacterium sp. TAE3-ERU12]|uniref:glycoside hydrolase family 16 protein n=1 Tax=Corynebacterium sp. TAE3-ERU12 TaxID=2849491 RepID=UPI001C43DA66|nr:glycoside hydrolase family 16 protein [Corynebacterium sp. TAE3-ERU12]MBV7295635.1 glycoside hydrolase family 16 protein [Corynebacterium sp. TAE3-ERU12]